MAFDDFLNGDCKPDAAAGMVAAVVKPLKDQKDALAILGFDTDSIVLNLQTATCRQCGCRDLYAWRIVAAIFDRVLD